MAKAASQKDAAFFCAETLKLKKGGKEDERISNWQSAKQLSKEAFYHYRNIKLITEVIMRKLRIIGKWHGRLSSKSDHLLKCKYDYKYLEVIHENEID